MAYKTVEKKDSTLYLGETRVEQEGKVGKERIFTAVNPSGSKEEKLREVVEARQTASSWLELNQEPPFQKMK